MSIYIKGLEMPKNDSMIVAIRPDGMVEDVMGCYVGKAVSVPPHGRLGDLDALAEKAIMRSEKRGILINVLDKVITAYDIETAPTIIQASEEATHE